MVDAHQRWRAFGQQLYKPLRDSTPDPIFFRSRWRRNFDGLRGAVRDIHPQTPEACVRSFGAGIVNADVALECRHQIRCAFRAMYSSRDASGPM